MAIRRSRPWLRAAWAVGLALAAHGLILSGLMLLSTPLTPRDKTPIVASDDPPSNVEEMPFEIDSIVDDLQQPTKKSFLEKWREEEVKKEQESKNPTGQVVELPKPLVEERPDSAKYLSEYDSKIDREKKAPPGKGGSALAAAPRGQPVPEMSGGAMPDKMALAMRTPSFRLRGEGESGQFVSPATTAKDSKAASSAATGELGSAKAGGTAGLPEGAPGSADLHPTQQMLERAIGSAPGSLDYLKDIDDGDSTALNAKKWKHAPFFNRVKRQVASQWHPDTVYIQHDPSGHVYGLRDRITVVRVHLDEGGKLVHSDLAKSSGVDFLDDEALAAFDRAGPFPNPPKDLVESDGKIHFNFAFIFQVSGSPGFKIFRN